MKQLDRKTKEKIMWLSIPAGIVCLYDIYVLFFSNDYAESGKICLIATIITLTIPLAGACIAAVKQKCWRYLANILAMAAVLYICMFFLLWVLLTPADELLKLTQ